MHRPRQQRRGFALIVVVILVGLLSIGAASMLDLVGVDQVLAQRQLQSQQALSAAEAGVYEVITSNAFDQNKPKTFADPVAKFGFAGKPGAILSDSVVSSALGGTYQTEVVLVGLGTVENCSLNLCAQMNYDVTAMAETGGQLAQSEVRLRRQQTVTLPRGRIITPIFQR